MSGNCATGMLKIASRPASVTTIERTKASRGRSMKRPEIMGSSRWGRATPVARHGLVDRDTPIAQLEWRAPSDERTSLPPLRGFERQDRLLHHLSRPHLLDA